VHDTIAGDKVPADGIAAAITNTELRHVLRQLADKLQACPNHTWLSRRSEAVVHGLLPTTLPPEQYGLLAPSASSRRCTDMAALGGIPDGRWDAANTAAHDPKRSSNAQALVGAPSAAGAK
jgi:hypothetical protein